MLIKVTQEHIDKALEARKSLTYSVCEECPIALALREIFENVIVGIGIIRITKNSKEILLPSPSDVKWFIRSFDIRAKVRPFEFELEVQS